MSPTQKQTAAGIAAVAAIFAAIAVGSIAVEHPDQTAADAGPVLHARVAFPPSDAGVPADTACARIVAVGPSAAWSALGLDTSEPDYAVGYVCAPPSTEPVTASLPDGVRVIEQEIVPFADGMGRLEIWSSRHPDAPKSGCACSTGADCERLVRTIDGAESWLAAPKGSAMPPGEWRGDCLPMVSCYDVSELPLGSNLAEGCR